MKKKLMVLGGVLILIFMSRIYMPITGTVVDVETGNPIEGAVVLVEWTKTKGFGLTYTKPYRISEDITDKNGKIHISGVYNFFVNPPRITVYKKGYVAWNNLYIFPSWGKRTDFRWTNGIKINLAHYKKEYSLADHVFFLHSVTHWGKLINKAYRWEELEKEKQR